MGKIEQIFFQELFCHYLLHHCEMVSKEDIRAAFSKKLNDRDVKCDVRILTAVQHFFKSPEDPSPFIFLPQKN